MDKDVEEYKEIFSSLTEVPLRCEVKHSIDLTPGVSLPNISIPYVTTQKESTHVLSEVYKEIKFTKRIQHVCLRFHDIFDKSST